jgi:hypothetical protein
MQPVHILSATAIVPAIVGTIYIRHLPKYGKLIVCFLYASLLSEVTSITMTVLVGNNLIVFYFYCCIAALCLGAAYSLIFGKRLYYFGLVPLIAIIESFTIGTKTFNSFSFTALNLIIITTAILTFSKMIFGRVNRDIFWFNGILFFSAASNCIFYFNAVFAQWGDMHLMQSMFWIHAWVNAVTNFAFAYSIWMLSRSYTSVR